METAKTLDLRGVPQEDCRRQVGNLIQILQPGDSFFIVTEDDISLVLTDLTRSQRDTLQLIAIQASEKEWNTKIVRRENAARRAL